MLRWRDTDIFLAEDSNNANAAAYGGGYGGAPGGVPPPPPEADPNLSGSDRESVGEAADDVRDAQADYNEALASGSSSDIEEAREDLADAHEEVLSPGLAWCETVLTEFSSIKARSRRHMTTRVFEAMRCRMLGAHEMRKSIRSAYL